jgi:hypothetical protein
VQPDRVVLVAYPVEFAFQLGRLSDLVQVGCSPLTWENSDSVHAWSLGVAGRPKRWAMAQAAMNALVDFDVIWVPLSLMASSTGIGAVSGTLPRASSASSRASMRCPCRRRAALGRTRCGSCQGCLRGADHCG